MRSSRGKLHRQLIAGLVAGLLVTGCGSQGRTPNATRQIGTGQIQAGGPRVAGLGGKFAGVIWTGDVQSIGAHWQVPEIRAGSQPGRAATWIGAQGYTTRAGTPFIQIGTREELDRSSATGRQGELFDEAFWADAVRGLHPVSLFAVHPGDTVAARMSLQGQRWMLTIADQTTGQKQRVGTGEEGTGHFKLGLWLQEDPTVSATNGVFAYPDLSPVRVSALTVNAARPAAAALETTWMALPRAYLGPTAPAGDAFSVVPRMLTPAAERYLRIADPANAQINHFFAVSSAWRRGVSQPVVRAAIHRLVSALETNAARLQAQHWPADVAGLVRRLAGMYASQGAALRRAVDHGPRAVIAALPHGTDGQAHARLAGTIRDRLGLPLSSY